MTGSGRGELWRRLAALPPADRSAVLTDAVAAEFRTALLMADDDEFSPTQNLFDLGLTSVRAVETRERLQAALGCDIAISDLFERSAVRDLVAYLAGGPLAELFPAAAPVAKADASRVPLAGRAAVQARLNRLHRPTPVTDGSSGP